MGLVRAACLLLCLVTGSLADSVYSFKVVEIWQKQRGSRNTWLRRYGMTASLNMTGGPSVPMECGTCQAVGDCLLTSQRAVSGVQTMSGDVLELTIDFDAWQEDVGGACTFDVGDEERVTETCILNMKASPAGITHDFTCDGGNARVVVRYNWEPSTPAPATPSPPTTSVPDTAVPPTPSLPTPAPSTPAPATPSPHTSVPPTAAPPTPAPATPAPATPSPPTPAYTAAPPTASPPAPPSPSPACAVTDTFAQQCAPKWRHCLLQVQHLEGVLSVAFSHDGTLVAAGAGGAVRVFSTATGQEVVRLGCADFAAHDIDFSPDGTRIAVGGAGGRAVVCDAATGELMFPLGLRNQNTEVPVRRVAFSSDGSRVVCGGGSDQATRVFDAHVGGTPLLVVQGHAADVSFAQNGTLLATAGSGAGAVRLWDSANGASQGEASGPFGSTAAIAFSADGKELLRAYEHGYVHVWSRAAGGTRLSVQAADGVGRRLTDVQYLVGGRAFATAASDGAVVVWDATSGRDVLRLGGHQKGVARVAVSPDGQRLATAGTDGSLLLWDVSGL